MKLTLIYFSSIFIFLASCGSVKDKVEDHFDSRLIVSDSSRIEIYSFKGEDTSLLIMDYQYFRYDTLTGKAALPYQNKVNSIIVDFITNVTYRTYMDEIKSGLPIFPNVFDYALNEFAIIYEDAIRDEGDSLWYFESSSEIEDNRKYFCQISNYNWVYTGGAHGNGFSAYHQIGKVTGKELLLTDFISNIEELTRIADTIFRKDYELSFKSNLAEEGYWFDGGLFKLNENFLFEKDKLIFVFNQYEAAPYSAGSFRVEVPLEEINHLLKPKHYSK